MNTLIDAWDWYQATSRNLRRMQRLGRNHWNDDSLRDASIFRDESFKMLEASDIIHETTISLKPIDDLAIIVLFSVFESTVRDYLVALIRPEADSLSDPILRHASEDAIHGIEEGSFYRRVPEPLKQQERVSAELITQIDQVRDYRNWVAHGRRNMPVNNVSPQDAFDRLKQFLSELGIAVESEQREENVADEMGLHDVTG